MLEDETRKQIAAGSEEQGVSFRTSFDPFNMIMQQLNRLDEKLDAKMDKIDVKIDRLNEKLDANSDRLDRKLDSTIAKLDGKIDALHQELHNTTRWIIVTIVAVAGVAVALASWQLQ